MTDCLRSPFSRRPGLGATGDSSRSGSRPTLRGQPLCLFRAEPLLQHTCIRTSLVVRQRPQRFLGHWFERSASLDHLRFSLALMKATARFLIGALATTACGPESVQEPVSFPLWVAGSGQVHLETESGFDVILERADLAFGPLYFCAGFSSGQHCETARLQWLETTVVDTLDRDPKRAGSLEGVTGPIRSWMYDLGISSSLTAREPVVLSAAEQLGGVSIALRGHVFTERAKLAFTARVALQSGENSELGVPIVRKSTNERFTHEVTAEERGLLVRFDSSPWLRAIDFDRRLAPAPCRVGRERGCADDAALTCDSATGEVLETQPCTSEQLCLEDVGCTDHFDATTHGVALRALRQALESDSRPAFEWDQSP